MGLRGRRKEKGGVRGRAQEKGRGEEEGGKARHIKECQKKWET